MEYTRIILAFKKLQRAVNTRTWRIAVALLMFSVTVDAQKEEFFISNERKVYIKQFDEEVEKMMKSAAIPGVSLAVIEDDKVVFSNAYGYKQADSRKKVNKRTVFEAASLTKVFFVFVVYKLVEAGKIDLDKPLYQYLEYPPLQHDSRYKLITARMILGHASGIENWKDMNNADTLEILANPGEKFIYSGEAYNYLEKVVALILNKNYNSYMNDFIFKPLALKRTFTQFRFHNWLPSNYVYGHDGLGNKVDKRKNSNPVASSGNHMTAKDFAELIIAMFDSKHLSDQSVKEILTPVSKLAANYRFYGQGMEVQYYGNDTIVSHGGHNRGFMSYCWYSVPKKRGFVLMTNSERGLAMINRLNQMSVQLNIDPILKGLDFEQYPGYVPELVKLYKSDGFDKLFARIEELNKNRSEGFSDKTLNQLGDIFYYENPEAAKKILEYSIKSYPNSAPAFFVLAYVNMLFQHYESAYQNLIKATELGYLTYPVDYDMKDCAKKIALNAPKSYPPYDIRANEKSTIQAEDYIGMSGVMRAGAGLGWINAGDWVEYTINVTDPGIYEVAFKVATPTTDNHLELQSGEKVLASIDVQPTSGWDDWHITKASVQLPQGIQTLRILTTKGSYNIDWLQLSSTGQ